MEGGILWNGKDYYLIPFLPCGRKSVTCALFIGIHLRFIDKKKEAEQWCSALFLIVAGSLLQPLIDKCFHEGMNPLYLQC